MWFTTSSGRIELNITKKQVETLPPCGDQEKEVRALLQVPAIRRQFNKLDPATIAAELSEYGVGDSEELTDTEMNKVRLLWIACGDIRENLNSQPIKLENLQNGY